MNSLIKRIELIKLGILLKASPGISRIGHYIVFKAILGEIRTPNKS